MNKTKWKTTLLIVLCTLVLILGAALPGILAQIHEHSYQPGYAAMNSVELQLRGQITMAETLSVVSNSTNTLEVSADMASRTEEEILELAEQLLKPYLDAGLIYAPGLDIPSQAYSCKPYLTVSEGEPAATVIAWQVLILHDEEEPALMLGIDDRTGALLVLDFHSSKTEFFDKGSYFVPDETIDTLYRLYSASFGEDFSGYPPSVTETYTASDGVTAQHCTITWETAYGPAGIDFDVWPFGVSISLF